MFFSPVFSNKQDDGIKKTNKSFVKTIQSPDGDIIDCVLTHLQPAFERPELRRQVPLEEPEPSSWQTKARTEPELKQVWNSKGESCPRGTIPIRRTNKNKILTSNPIPKFGKRLITQVGNVYAYEHAMAYVQEEKYYGAKASLNVWDPSVTNPTEFSGSQIHLFSPRTYDLNDGDNAIEAGWMTQRPKNGCFNLLCSGGFVQTSNTIALGGAIAPVLSYNSTQIEISISIWKVDITPTDLQSTYNFVMWEAFLTQRLWLWSMGAPWAKTQDHLISCKLTTHPLPTELHDIGCHTLKMVVIYYFMQSPKYGVWWLKVGSSTVGYWPDSLFTHLKDNATFVGFGGRVLENVIHGQHTSTQMGSGHFPEEGLGKAAYVRYMEVVVEGFKRHPVSPQLLVEAPYCYNATSGFHKKMGRDRTGQDRTEQDRTGQDRCPAFVVAEGSSRRSPEIAGEGGGGRRTSDVAGGSSRRLPDLAGEGGGGRRTSDVAGGSSRRSPDLAGDGGEGRRTSDVAGGSSCRSSDIAGEGGGGCRTSDVAGGSNRRSPDIAVEEAEVVGGNSRRSPDIAEEGVKAVLDIDEVGIRFSNSFWKLVGDGSGVKVWEDIWVEEGRLRDRFGPLYQLEVDKEVSIAERCEFVGEKWSWNWEWRREP
ncbi:hypothetical protein OSB04_000906 [Centaurea solstitialis]|uniref:Neprosin PEP catalytic domain-containing protein n=1 Tax=Centaurea solstitialis TaxID=347529 RepID=A0AA38U1S3_9ASTR|nr:hypothetical protein OSB04_000906 [Centaurea solstitialis]